MRANFLYFIGGALPFISVLIEMTFIMQSIWKDSVIYLFTFVFAIFLILVAICAEISIVITYMTLCHRNHKWWWRSFLASGFCGVYILLYSIYYFTDKMNVTRLSSSLIYFGIMGFVSFTMFIFCGTIGFVSSLLFVRKIYGLIKV